MKKIILGLALMVGVLTLVSFKNKENAENSQYQKMNQTDLVAKGKALFTQKTCVTCHKADAKLVGPSLQTIAKTYKAKNASLLKFFKGESKSIVEPAMAAIMAVNVQTITKPMSDNDLKAIIAYIKSTVK